MGDGSRVPICVDLDGTLLRGDVLVESLLKLLREKPLDVFRFPLWLSQGRARFKQRVADRVRLDPTALLYNPELLEFLEQQRAAGRQLLLVTASHVSLAQAVADHVGLFDEVLATDGRLNLKGRHKRTALVERFGEAGFDYAGNSAADLPVWSAAREAIVVNASPGVIRRLGDRSKRVFDAPRHPMPTVALRAIRIHQWVKNLLLFLPTLLAHRYLDPEPLTHAAAAFLSFSLAASAIYVLNDLLDVEADRHHPTKRLRPFAAGELALSSAALLVPLLVGLSVGVAFFLPREFHIVLLLYFLLATLYNLYLKQIVLVDILLLASLYTLRIIAGAAASTVAVSEWLLAFSVFFFISLGAVKRYTELHRLTLECSMETKVSRRGYFAGDREIISQLGMASGFIAALVFALYITGEAVRNLYSTPVMLWFVCPLLIYWTSRVWLLAHRGELQDDPVIFAVKDPTTWLLALLSAAIVLGARGVW